MNEIRAIIWDYDGTLVDTMQKNLNVTRQILRHITGPDGDGIPTLQSLGEYTKAVRQTKNWRELYLNHYGLSAAQTDEAGRLWTEFQLQDSTPTPSFEGIDTVLDRLRHFPHGIVSQNSSANIKSVLQKNNLLPYFRHVVGYEEVPFEKQKPEPDGVLLCLQKIAKWRPGIVFYIGDHETDALCVFKANEYLQSNLPGMKILSIAVFYDSENHYADWAVKPDYTVRHPNEIVDIVENFCFL